MLATIAALAVLASGARALPTIGAYLIPVPASVQPSLAGSVVMESSPNGSTWDLTVTLNVSGVTTNQNAEHGVHIHWYGDFGNLDPTVNPPTNDGASVGALWNPTNATYSCPPSPSLWGDLGNWAFVGGAVSAQKTFQGFTSDPLVGSVSAVGRAIVINAAADNCSDPSSISGVKLGFGVLGILNVAGNTASQEETGINASCFTLPTSASFAGGAVQFTPNGTGVIVAYVAGGIVQTDHGFHVHWYGDVVNRTGLDMGGHFNPASSPHALPPRTPRHVGDMGNAFYWVGSGLTAQLHYRFFNDYMTVGGTGANNIVGRGVVLHELPDDCSQPAGNAGSRLLIGVIGVANPATEAVPISGSTPWTQDDSPCDSPTTTGAGNPSTSAAEPPSDSSAPALLATATSAFAAIIATTAAL